MNDFSFLPKNTPSLSRETILVNEPDKVLPSNILTSQRMEKERISSSTKSLIIGTVVGGVAAGILLLVATIVYLRRLRQKSHHNSPPPREISTSTGDPSKRSSDTTTPEGDPAHPAVPYAAPAPAGPAVFFKDQCRSVVVTPQRLPSAPLWRVVLRSAEPCAGTPVPVAVARPMEPPVATRREEEEDAYSA
jgi:hypothetical protein